MLKLSIFTEENQFAIPWNIFLKPILLLILEIMTYLGNGEFKRDLFGYNVQDFQTTKVNQMIPGRRYIVPLDAGHWAKSYKDLMEKEIKIQNLTHFS